MNFMVPLLEEGDEGQEQRNQPLTLEDHKLSQTKCQWFLFFSLNLCFIIWCILEPSITILLAYLAFIPSLIMYKWWRKIYRRGGLPKFPDTVREYTLAFWYAHFISFVAVVFWILLIFELTLASTWRATHREVSEQIMCEDMVLFDTTCAYLSAQGCEFNGPFALTTDGCSWNNDFGGCVTFEANEDNYYPCTSGINGTETFYDQESYQEKVDLETFQKLRSSLELNAFMIFLTIGKGTIEQSIKYYFSQKSRKKFPTMLSETHIDGILYLVTIIGIAFGTAEAILDVAVDLMAGNTILFLLVSLFFGTLNHGVTSYIIGIGLCKRYILRQNDQTYFRIVSVPILIQWCFDYGKWWLLDYSSDRPIIQLFFAIMCITAFVGGYCVLSRQRLNLRDQFLSGGMAQIENSGVQLQVTSYCTEEDNDGFKGPEGNQTKENDKPPPAYEEPGEQSYIPEENPEQQVKKALGAVDGKEEETLLLAQSTNNQAITSSTASDEEEHLNDAKSLSEVELLDGPPSSGKPSKRDALERRTGDATGPSQD